MKTPVCVLLAMAAMPLVSGCATAVVAAAAGTGLMVAQDRSVGAGLDDHAAFVELKARLLAADNAAFRHVDLQVNEGLVVMSGVVPTAEHRAQAEQIAWGLEQVTDVGNEIDIGVPGGVLRTAADELIESQIVSRLIADNTVKGINFVVTAHNGEVYLTGYARTQAELDRVALIASHVRGVTRVVSYMNVRPDRTHATMARPAGPAPGSAPVTTAGESASPSLLVPAS